MNPFRALRRLFSNSDRLVEVSMSLLETLNRLDDKAERLVQAAENQATSVNDRLDRLLLSMDNQSTAVNRRMDEQIGLMKRSLAKGGGDQHASLESLGTANSDLYNRRYRADLKWLEDRSPEPLPLTVWKAGIPNGEAGAQKETVPTNALQYYQPLLEALQPWQGFHPKGFLVDFFGILTDTRFRALFGADPDKTGGYLRTELPRLEGENGEWWFEAINWIEAARAARGRFVMITLGACYGAQAVGAYRALQTINPMPCKLVAIEPEPENYLWMRKHFRDNGIDPDAHWLVSSAISDENKPIFFPIGGAGWGANNCMSTDQPKEREILADQLISQGKADEALRSLMLRNTTGILTDMLPGQEVMAEIEIVSAVTLRDLLGPFDLVDYLEADIQQSEVRVFPPFLDLLRQKVRRIHIGTHGAENHEMLHDLFARAGWEIIFSYAPNATYETPIGKFDLNDGVLTVRNPDL
jgi:hypothetical protein